MDESAKRPRGRPRQYDPEVALAHATGLFWDRGYSGTSLDDLAVATGMNRPSLYAAFGDKKTLYLRTLERYAGQIRAVAMALLEDDPPLAVALTRFYQGALDMYVSGPEARGCYPTCTATAEAAADPDVRAFLADSIRQVDRFMAKLIERGRQRGEIGVDQDPESLARLATATLHTLAVRARAGYGRAELDDVVSATIKMICRT